MTDLKYPIGKFDASDKRWTIGKDHSIDYLFHYPNLLFDTINGFSESQMLTPYRLGGWTVSQLIHHIADSHMNAYIRFKLSLTELKPTIKPYNEGKWAELPDSNLELISLTKNMIVALHAKWGFLMRSMSTEQWTKNYYHPEDQKYVELSTALKMYHWHSAHHLAHITTLMKIKNW